VTADPRQRSRGTVVCFDHGRGYGVIELDGGQGECLVHRDELAGRSLRAGDRLEFDAVLRDRGLVATRVFRIGPLDGKESSRVEIGRPAGPRRLFRKRARPLRFGRL
jgi:cold shock CspA family protein